MKIVSVNIAGTSPYLMHKFSDENTLEKKSRRIEVTSETPRQKAEKVAYINLDGSYYFSAASIPGCMANAGVNHKMVGTRKTLKYIVPSAVRTLTDTIVLLDGESPAPNFEVDARPVTIPATKGRVMRYRPRFDRWNANFELGVNDDLISLDMVHQLLNEAGVSIGIGDYRPAKGGPFGCFRVTRFES